MNVQLLAAKAEHYSNLGRYFYAEMVSGKHHASFAFAPDYVQVCVHNASNRVWRGMGKRFATVEAAIANYKTAAVRSMIEEAARMNLAEAA
jgi:hypothetical protein